MSCNNCFNGCAETISDQCVKYTGIDVPALGISTGDNLLAVENAIVNFLVPAINGTGIKPIIDPNIICDLVKSYLPACTTCTGFTLNEILTAIVKTVCDLQTQIDVIDATLNILNAPYKVGCLSGVTTSSETHDVLQATIDNLCSLNSAFSILVAQLAATNVTIFNVDSFIAAYLASSPLNNLASSRMVPYAPIPYFGPLSNYPSIGDSFSIGGVGSGYWANVYLCNGANPGVPDLRGRTLVGATTGMGGGTLNQFVDPGIAGSGNPNYSLFTLAGANQVQLTKNQMPSHNHLNNVDVVSIVDEQPHSHGVYRSSGNGALELGDEGFDNNNVQNGLIAPAKTNLTVDTSVTVDILYEGGGQAHSNIQPSIGTYYIIYIP